MFFCWKEEGLLNFVSERIKLFYRINLLASSETLGQIVGARESLNRRKNVAQKKSKERVEEPLGTMSYQTSSKRSPPFWLLIGARKTQVFWHKSEARTAATVWNWSGKTLSPGALVAVLYFSSCLIFPPVYSGMLRHGSPSNLHNLAKWHLKRIVLISRHETWQEVLPRWP